MRSQINFKVNLFYKTFAIFEKALWQSVVTKGLIVHNKSVKHAQKK